MGSYIHRCPADACFGVEIQRQKLLQISIAIYVGRVARQQSIIPLIDPRGICTEPQVVILRTRYGAQARGQRNPLNLLRTEHLGAPCECRQVLAEKMNKIA